MATICPTITAFNEHQYSQQLQRLQPFAQRIHIDLMDGEFAPTNSPGLDKIWWPPELVADIHLMYQRPMETLERLIFLRPHLVIIHNEADVHHMHFAAELHKHDIKVGLAILQDTPIQYAHQVMHSFDHVLIFSGKLGHHGGTACLSLLDKVAYVREHHPDAEIGWDGGVSADNATQLIAGGVDVLNVGGHIQNATQPSAVYKKLVSLTNK